MCIMTENASRETFCNGVELSLLFVSVKIYFQNMVPGIEKTQIILLLLIWWLSVKSFGVSLWVCMESSRNILLVQFCAKTWRCFYNFYQRCFFLFFNFNYMCKFTGIFVSAVITCDKFLCCYWQTFRCRSWPSSEPSWIT